MFSLRHFIEIFADPSIVRMAISNTEGIQAWWAKDARSDDVEGGKVRVNFGKDFRNIFEIEKQSSTEVCWLVVEGNEEWLGTRIRFQIENSETMVTLRFSHEGWKKETDFYAGCNLQWDHYLLSLKNYCEVGRGKPYGR